MIIDCAHYEDGKRQKAQKVNLEEAARCAAKGGTSFVWLGLLEPSVEEIEEVSKTFGLHELAVEDAERAHQRPKLEDYGNGHYFIVLRPARYDDEREEIAFGEIHVFVGPGYVISVRHGEATELHQARVNLEKRPDLLELGPPAVVWAIVDAVVDDYAPVVEGLENDIEETEVSVFKDNVDATQRIYFLKREAIEFRRAVWPLLEPLNSLEGGDYPVGEELQRFFRDVADHARRIEEQVTSQRELLTSILEANLALVSVRQNEVVKKISSWAGIIAVPTFIASVYGMNFDHMPELHTYWGYPAALLTMAAVSYALYRYFKHVGWI